MKIARVCNPYPAYLQSFYSQRPHLVNGAYHEQIDALSQDACAGFGSWFSYLNGAEFEVMEYSANNEAAQRAWLRENQKEKLEDLPWFEAVLLAQLKIFKPEILFMQDYATFSAAFVRTLRDRLPSVKRVVVWCGAPYSDPEIFRSFDAVFSCVPEIVADFKSRGHRCILNDHGFDERVLGHLSEMTKRPRGATFIGQVVRRAGFHGKREQLLSDLLKFPEFEIYTPSANLGFSDLGKYLIRFSGANIRRFFPDSIRNRLPEKIFPKSEPYFPVLPSVWWRAQPGVFGVEMYAVLRDSLFTINRHIDVSEGSASNMRLFEATGVGACLLTDKKPDLGRFFSQDEVVTYNSNEDCAAKVRWLLDNPEEAQTIALRGQQRTLKSHGLSIRLPELARHLKSIV